MPEGKIPERRVMTQPEDNVKLGLALSGGGFRSAFFHVGVLARLAEADILRRVDVISSVSGGSIIAAYYYLKVKALLEDASGEAPGRAAYIRLVREIERDFLGAVQKNMLIRTFLDPVKNSRMRAADFSNTERLGELLTKYFYLPLLEGSGKNKKNRIPLKDIAISPPARHLEDGARVPKLILNCTCLNTGHLWQFTDESAGEHPTMDEAGHDIGFLEKFRMDDHRLTIEQRKILYNVTLGQAVAASCCVPGIFEPLMIRHLYKNGGRPMTVRLADGGLVDNQGLASLFVGECTHIICSDASDILTFERDPSIQFLDAAMRANDILLDRIRSKSLKELFAYGPSAHLLFDLGDHDTRDHVLGEDSAELVTALTRIRTDLDSFTDREADTLMYYGYQLSTQVMEKSDFALIGDNTSEPGDWRFLAVRDLFLTDAAKRRELLYHLEVGARQMFKAFLFKKPMPYLILLPLPTLLGLVMLYLLFSMSPLLFWGLLLVSGLGLATSQNHKILKLMDNVAFLSRMKRRTLKAVVALRLPEPFSYVLALGSWIQLTLFDPLFLKYGRIRKPSDKPGTAKNKR